MSPSILHKTISTLLILLINPILVTQWVLQYAGYLFETPIDLLINPNPMIITILVTINPSTYSNVGVAVVDFMVMVIR